MWEGCSSSSAWSSRASGLLMMAGRPARPAARRHRDPPRQRDVLLSARDVDCGEHHPDACCDSAAVRRPTEGSRSSNVNQARSLDQENGARARHDRAVRGPPGAGGRRLVRPVVLRLRHPRRRRVQGLHQHQQHGHRSEELRSAVVRRRQGRRLHRAAELVRAGAHDRVLPDSRATC